MMLRNRIAIAFAFAAAAALAGTGCFAQGKAFERIPPSSTHAIVYVYRPYHLTGSADDPMVTCGHATLAIRSGGYHPFTSDPGTITCATDGGGRVSFEVRPGEEYFVREVVAMHLGPDRASLVKVGHGIGMDEISSCAKE